MALITDCDGTNGFLFLKLTSERCQGDTEFAFPSFIPEKIWRKRLGYKKKTARHLMTDVSPDPVETDSEVVSVFNQLHAHVHVKFFLLKMKWEGIRDWHWTWSVTYTFCLTYNHTIWFFFYKNNRMFWSSKPSFYPHGLRAAKVVKLWQIHCHCQWKITSLEEVAPMSWKHEFHICSRPILCGAASWAGCSSFSFSFRHFQHTQMFVEGGTGLLCHILLNLVSDGDLQTLAGEVLAHENSHRRKYILCLTETEGLERFVPSSASVAEPLELSSVQ